MSDTVDAVFYAATLAQRDLYRSRVERLEAELAAARRETDTLREALERIALGIAGRVETGLRPTEVADYLPQQPKADWQLAGDALAAVSVGEGAA